MTPPRTLGRIGRYTLLGTLADGGMARVFLAQKDDSEEMCVLKQLHLELEEHATASIRFRREAVIVRKLSHPNIAKVLDSGFQGSRFYLVMEFISGQTVEDVSGRLRKEKNPMPPSIALAIIACVLDGLTHAHDITGEDGERLRLVHRDLSPRNVMIGYDGMVRIIDFGLASAQMEDDDFRTGPGILLGTLSYMAPEQALTLNVDARSDLYSVGVMLYELLTDRPLLPPAAPTETIRRIVRDSPPKLRSVKPNLPDGLERVLDRALTKGPDGRYQSAREFRDDLLRCWGELPSQEELGAFVRGLFGAEERETRWLLDAAHSLHADHRNFFEDTIEDRFDKLVSLDKLISFDSRPDSLDSIRWLDKTDPQLGRFDDATTDEIKIPVRIALDRLDTDTEVNVSITPTPVAARPFEQTIRNLSRGGQLDFSLRQMPLDEGLLLLHESRFTGTLDLGVAAPDFERIYFRGGAVVGVSPNRKIDHELLGHALIDLQLVTADALQTVPRGLQDLDAELLGRYLIQRGLIDDNGLARARIEQARRRLYRLFERKEANACVREGLEHLKSFHPTMVDIRPIVAYGMVVCSDLERKNQIVQQLRNKTVRMTVPYDEDRNGYGLPPPIMEAIRPLREGLRLGPMPMLPGLDPMTTAGVLLLLDRSALLTVSNS